MSNLKFRVLVLACAACAAACAKSEAASASSHDATPAASSAAEAGPPLAIDCKKVFAPGDVAGILVAPASVSTDTQFYKGACRFDTPKGADINVMVGSDDNAQYYWYAVTATSDNKHYTAMSGVGDSAVWWDASGATAFVYAKKGEKYCRVELGITGGAEQETASVRGIELAKKLGALCIKAFAAT